MVGMDAGQFTIGNGITIAVVIFGAGGAWVAVKIGLSDLKAHSSLQFDEFNKKMDGITSDVKAQFVEVHKDMDVLKGEFVRADVNRERDKNIDLRMGVVAEEVRRANARIDELSRKS